MSRTLCCILFLIAAGAGLRDYWIDKTAFRDAVVITGTVTESGYTSWSFGDVDQQIIGYRFELHGQTYDGFSFDMGGGWQKGRSVEIEYKPADPNIARIVGLEYSQFQFLVYMPLILAFFLVILAVRGTLRTYRWGRLLEHGTAAEAELKDRESIRAKKAAELTELTFQFSDASGTVHEVKTDVDAKLRAKGPKIILYDPANPQEFLFLSQLPFRLSLIDKGHWAPPENKRSLLGWFAFSIGLLLWAIYLIAKLRS